MAACIGRTPFVARDREMAALRARLDAAGQGRGGGVLVVGEPGIGKTRLVVELWERAGREGWHVFAGQAYEAEGMPAYLPITTALGAYVRSCPLKDLTMQLGPGAAEVAVLVHEVRARLPELPLSPPLSLEHERYHLFESVSAFLLAVARSGPRG